MDDDKFSSSRGFFDGLKPLRPAFGVKTFSPLVAGGRLKTVSTRGVKVAVGALNTFSVDCPTVTGGGAGLSVFWKEDRLLRREGFDSAGVNTFENPWSAFSFNGLNEEGSSLVIEGVMGISLGANARRSGFGVMNGVLR